MLAAVITAFGGPDVFALAEIPEPVFANSVSYVDQDIFLFEGTARDNLTLWDRTVSEAHLLMF